jgi:hypothetical protein
MFRGREKGCVYGAVWQLWLIEVRENRRGVGREGGFRAQNRHWFLGPRVLRQNWVKLGRRGGGLRWWMCRFLERSWLGPGSLPLWSILGRNTSRDTLWRRFHCTSKFRQWMRICSRDWNSSPHGQSWSLSGKKRRRNSPVLLCMRGLFCIDEPAKNFASSSHLLATMDL